MLDLFKKQSFLKILAPLVLNSNLVHSENQELSSTNPCISSEATQSCNACIQASPICQWCEYPNLSKNVSRCEKSEFWSNNNLCLETKLGSNLIDLKGEYKVEDNLQFGYQPNSPSQNQNDQILVQMRPQRSSAVLRQHESRKMNITFKLAEDYPVDLYYLMDLSQSMYDDLKNLRKLGTEIAARLRNLTSDLQMGFGSFVDKPVMPFINTLPERLENPCINSGHKEDGSPSKCETPYAFKNSFKLSPDIAGFIDNLNAADHSSNLDAPEGGLEAMMQAIVCGDKIGWRNGNPATGEKAASKLLVYSSDAGFHSAGDGKLAGIIIPNDMKCHLADDGMTYTAAKDQDYPSVGQIKYQLGKHDIQPIFAVTEHVINVYDSLANLISDRPIVRPLTDDSSNIVEVIAKAYEDLRGQLTIKPNTPDEILVKPSRAFCQGVKGPVTYDTFECKDIKQNVEIVFEVEITAEKCLGDSSTEVVFRAEGYGNDMTKIGVSTLCECSCKNKGQPLIRTPDNECQFCNNNGNYNCGICECNSGFGGDCCNCDINSVSDYKEHEKKCKRPGSLQVCSGRGECVCGVCICHKLEGPKQIQGNHCHCDNMSCIKRNGRRCNGHGDCSCGQCQCHEGWSGPGCECDENPDKCKAPNSDLICAGNGECNCGQCACYKFDEYEYKGKHCTKLMTTCGLHKEAVLSKVISASEELVWNTDPNRKYQNVSPEKQARIDAIYDVFESNEEATCRVLLEDAVSQEYEDCWIQFGYEIVDPPVGSDIHRQIKINYEKFDKSRHCPIVISAGAVVGIITAGIILLAVAILAAWKAVMMYLDRKELRAFNKDIAGKQYWKEENPLYTPATQTTKNPLKDN